MNYYELLDIPFYASSTEISHAYRKKIRNYHPDKTRRADLDKFYQIQEAYEILSNKTTRDQYDETFLTASQSTIKEISQKYDFTPSTMKYMDLLINPDNFYPERWNMENLFSLMASFWENTPKN